jgi:hypothetical protein
MIELTRRSATRSAVRESFGRLRIPLDDDSRFAVTRRFLKGPRIDE